MTPEEIRECIRDFIALVETPAHAGADESLALSLDRLALASHFAPGGYASGDDDPDAEGDARDPVEVYHEAWAMAAAAFPDYGYFAVASPFGPGPGDAQLTCADAIDALADITTQLKRVIAIWDGAGAEAALEEFGFSYRSHWRGHLRELQLYLHTRQTLGCG